ncbi:hypothetical protein P5V15_015607 [Pogonomyrmex californicus]
MHSTSVISSEASSNPAVCHVQGQTKHKRVLLSTAIVNAKGSNDRDCQLRILLDRLLDRTSKTNFITLTACKRLGLKLDEVCESVSGLNNMKCAVAQSCRLQLKSRTSNQLFEFVLFSRSKNNERITVVFNSNISIADPGKS